jgi:hypothetical protein
MTCVWDSLIAGIPAEEFCGSKKINKSINKNKLKPDIFINLLKHFNKKTENITVNNTKLTEKELEENYNTIDQFQILNLKKGYFCSTADPFLLSVCEIFQCSIWNDYCGETIKYEHPNPKFRILLVNSLEHMEHTRTIRLKKN